MAGKTKRIQSLAQLYKIKNPTNVCQVLNWAMRDLNPRPPQCRCDALPTAPIAQIFIQFLRLNRNALLFRGCATPLTKTILNRFCSAECQSPKYLFNFCASTETLCFFGDALPLSQKRYLIVFVFSFCFISDKSLILLSQLFAIVLTYSSSFAIAQLHSTQKPLGRVLIAQNF